MFTVRLRLAGLIQATDPQQAISLYTQVVQIDPLKLGVHQHIAEVYEGLAAAAANPSAAQSFLLQAVTEYQAELALSPVTPLEIQLTADTANNTHVHWALAAIYGELGQAANQLGELRLYVCATQWHSDVYPWRIAVANSLITNLQAQGVQAAQCPALPNTSFRKGFRNAAPR
jgi:hypothetical protein